MEVNNQSKAVGKQNDLRIIFDTLKEITTAISHKQGPPHIPTNITVSGNIKFESFA